MIYGDRATELATQQYAKSASGFSSSTGKHAGALQVILGIDEVGRGCWAGPLVVGAVVLAKPIEGLKDSKLLSKKRREQLDEVIRLESLAFGLGWVSAKEIDRLGLTRSIGLAINRSIAEIKCDIDEIIIDGNHNYLAKDSRARAIIKADQTVAACSAASIIAKVARDNFMAEQAETYQEYGFESHVGYGTKAHKLAIEKHGVREIHRKSFAPMKEMIA